MDPATAFSKARNSLAGQMFETCKGATRDIKMREFIPNCSPDVGSKPICMNSANPVLSAFLPADCLVRGGTLSLGTGLNSMFLNFVHTFLFFLAWLPEAMKEHLNFYSVAIYDLGKPAAQDGTTPLEIEGAAEPMAEEADEEEDRGSPKDAEEEEAQSAIPEGMENNHDFLSPEERILFKPDGDAETPTHPASKRRLLGWLFLVQENPEHSTFLDYRHFPLRKLSALQARTENDVDEATNEAEEGIDDEGEEAPRPKRSRNNYDYRVPITVAIKSIGDVWSQMMSNESADDKILNKNSHLSKKLSSAFPPAATKSVKINNYSGYSDLREAAQHCLPSLFDASDNYRRAEGWADEAEGDVSVFFRHEIVMREVDKRLGIPVGNALKENNSGRLVQGDVMIRASVGEEESGSETETELESGGEEDELDGYVRRRRSEQARGHRAFGMTCWKWRLTGGPMQSFFSLFSTRVPNHRFQPQIPFHIAQSHVSSELMRLFSPQAAASLEELSFEDRVHRVYYLLFGAYFSHRGSGRRLNILPSLAIYANDEACLGRENENVLQVLREWAVRKKHTFTAGMPQKNVSAVRALLGEFETHHGGIAGLQNLVTVTSTSGDAMMKISPKNLAEEGFFLRTHHEAMHTNGIKHRVAYQIMLPMLIYGASGNTAFSHMYCIGMPSTGKSQVLSTLKQLNGMKFISSFSDAGLAHLTTLPTIFHPLITDELLGVFRVAKGSKYTDADTKIHINNALENKEFSGMMRVLGPDNKYTSIFTATGNPFLMFAMGYNGPSADIDFSLTDRSVQALFIKNMKPDDTRRRLSQADMVFDMDKCEMPETLEMFMYSAQIARLKGFCERILGFPRGCSLLIESESINRMVKKYLQEGGMIDGPRIDATVVEFAIVISYYDAIFKALKCSRETLRNRKGRFFAAALTVSAMLYHIPTGVTYAQALSYMHDESEGNLRSLFVALVKDAIATAPALLAAAWNSSTIRVPKCVFDTTDIPALCEKMKHENYMDIGDDVMSSIIAKAERFHSTDAQFKRMLQITPSRMEVTFDHLSHCFTMKERDVLGEICFVDFIAPYPEVLNHIVCHLRALETVQLQARPESAHYDTAAEQDSVAPFAMDEDSNPAREHAGEDRSSYFRNLYTFAARVLKNSVFARDATQEKELYGKAFAMVDGFVGAFAGMKAGGESLITSEKRAYWKVSLEHLAAHPDGLFDTAEIPFTAEELYALCDTPDVIGGVGILAEYLRNTPLVTLEDSATNAFTVTPASYNKRDKGGNETIRCIWGTLGRLLSLFLVADKFFVIPTTTKKWAFRVHTTMRAKRGRDIISDPRFSSATLTVRNLTAHGSYSAAQLEQFEEVERSDDNQWITMDVADIILYAKDSPSHKVLADLFTSASFLIRYETDRLVIEMATHTSDVHREGEELDTSFVDSVMQYVDSQKTIERRKFSPCIRFKPGFVEPLHPRFQPVYDAIMACGSGRIHSEYLFRRLERVRHQTSVDTVKAVEKILRYDLVFSRFYQQVRGEAEPMPIDPEAAKAKAKNQFITPFQKRNEQIVVQREREEEERRSAAREAAEAGVIPPMADDGTEAEGEKDAGLAKDDRVTVDNVLSLPSKWFHPSKHDANGPKREDGEFVFAADYICFLFKRLLPPSARMTYALKAFTPLTPYNKAGVMPGFSPVHPDFNFVTFHPEAILFVPFGCESPFCPGEQLSLVYSPYTGHVMPHTPDNKIVNPDEAIYGYQRAFSSSPSFSFD